MSTDAIHCARTGAHARPHSGRDPRRSLGRLGEELAAAHLQRRGFHVLARNERTRHGEIDLIAFDGRALVFVEVKTRHAPRRGRALDAARPLASLSARQRIRVRKLARAWLADRTRARPTAANIRFDAIGLVIDGAGRTVSLEHIEGAW